MAISSSMNFFATDFGYQVPSIGIPGDGSAPELSRRLMEMLPALRRRARSLCKRAEDAEDLVQDTVVRALEFESSYRPHTHLRAWLLQILFSIFVMRYRRSRRERKILYKLEQDPCAWVRNEYGPVDRNLGSTLSAALEHLPEHFGVVVRLVDLEELAYKDVATKLNIPVGTVMSRLFRGRRILAEQLLSSERRLSAAA